jgi:hypothetical protein
MHPPAARQQPRQLMRLQEAAKDQNLRAGSYQHMRSAPHENRAHQGYAPATAAPPIT